MLSLSENWNRFASLGIVASNSEKWPAERVMRSSSLSCKRCLAWPAMAFTGSCAIVEGAGDERDVDLAAESDGCLTGRQGQRVNVLHETEAR